MSMQAPPTPIAPPTTAAPSKSKSKKSKEKPRKEKASLPNQRLKIIVRRLPPNLPEEIFWQSVANWVTDETVTWKAYSPGKPRKRLNKENVSSRAYIAFKKPEQVIVFSREYDGHLFRDKAGNEFQAIVEFAPYQKIPSEKKKPDARHATIEKDEDYISFVNSINATSNAKPVSLETLIASARPPSPPKTTPLLEALKAEKQAQKDKETILRHHPHYKDSSVVSSASTSVPAPTILSRKEEKRKAGAASASSNAPTKADTAPFGGGKKGKKPVQQAAKQIQIQTKSNALATPAASSGNAPSPSARQSQPPPKLQGTPSRGGKKHGRNALPASHPAVVTPASDEANANTPIAKPKELPSGASSMASAPSSATSTTTSATAGVAPTSPQPRRPRPVLGLGSRQFEAALSGVVGVAPGGERKSRREREKEKEKETIATTTAKDANTSNTSAQLEKSAQEKPSPTSPRRQRHRRMTNERSQATAIATSNGASEAGVSTPSVATAVNIQGINVAEPSNVSLIVPTSPISHPPNRGGGRRGRGGRGRVFPPRVG